MGAAVPAPLYVYNSPINYVDPTGHFAQVLPAAVGVLGALVGLTLVEVLAIIAIVLAILLVLLFIYKLFTDPSFRRKVNCFLKAVAWGLYCLVIQNNVSEWSTESLAYCMAVCLAEVRRWFETCVNGFNGPPNMEEVRIKCRNGPLDPPDDDGPGNVIDGPWKRMGDELGKLDRAA